MIDHYQNPNNYIRTTFRLYSLINGVNEETDELRRKVGKIAGVLANKHDANLGTDLTICRDCLEDLAERVDVLNDKKDEIKQFLRKQKPIIVSSICLGISSYMFGGGFKFNFFSNMQQTTTTSNILSLAQICSGLYNIFIIKKIWDNGKMIACLNNYLVTFQDLSNLPVNEQVKRWPKFLDEIESCYLDILDLNSREMPTFKNLQKKLNLYKLKIDSIVK